MFAFFYDLASTEYRLQTRQTLVGSTRPVAFVFIQGHFDFVDLASLFIHELHNRGQRNDFVVKGTSLLSRRCACL